MLKDAYIKNFLEIPVVLGIALCQEKLVTYYYLKAQIQGHPQKSALINQIRDAVFSAPEDIDFFECSIQNYHAYLYQLNEKYRILTLVLHENNVVKSFRAKQLCTKLQENIDTTLQLFKELSNHHSISGQSIQSIRETDSEENIQEINSIHNDSEKIVDSSLDIGQILNALNLLSQFVCCYLGPKVTSNFWNISRPKDEWLNQFEIKFSSEIIFSGNLEESISPLKTLSIREWTRNFMKQCCQLIRDLPERLKKENINEEYRKIISVYTSEYIHEVSKLSVSSSESLFEDIFL